MLVTQARELRHIIVPSFGSKLSAREETFRTLHHYWTMLPTLAVFL